MTYMDWSEYLQIIAQLLIMGMAVSIIIVLVVNALVGTIVRHIKESRVAVIRAEKWWGHDWREDVDKVDSKES